VEKTFTIIQRDGTHLAIKAEQINQVTQDAAVLADATGRWVAAVSLSAVVAIVDSSQLVEPQPRSLPPLPTAKEVLPVRPPGFFL
jgi:hypothetical protein